MDAANERNGGPPPWARSGCAATMAAMPIRPFERSKTMRLRVPVLFAAAVVVAVALVAAGCGGGGDKKGAVGGGGGDKKGAVGGGTPAANQVLKMAWGAEPPSLDPGLATD